MANEGSSENGNGLVDKEKKTEEVKKPPFSNYWRILSFGGRLEHVAIIVAICCSMASGTALPLMNIVFGNLSGDFTTYFLPDNTTTEHAFKHSVSRGALWIFILFIAKFILTYISIFCFRTMSLRISAALRLAYMESLFAQPVTKLDQVSAGTVADTITTNANTIQASVSDRLSGFFQSIALVIAAFAIAFRYSWALTLVTASGILFLIIVYSLITPGAIKSQVITDKADEKHATVAAEALGSIRTVFSLGAESKLIEKHTIHVDAAHKAGMDMAPRIALQLVPTYFTIYCCYALAFWYGIKLYQGGHIHSVSVVIIVFFSVLLVTAVAGMIVQPLMHINKAISASLNFFDMIDSDKVRVEGLKEPSVTAHCDVELQAITFAYPTRPGVTVLKDFTARFEKGKTTALVGPSGSGKSTIVALLERWYELGERIAAAPRDTEDVKGENRMPTVADQGSSQHQDSIPSGRVLVGGNDVSDFDLRWWRSQIGLVQQEPFLFNDTIENNVAFGLTGSAWEDADQDTRSKLVKEACREAFADEFIQSLPLGYSSLVGEGGIKLSGGQRQRIAIARSIVRKPAILILDEATSAIDVKGERIVQEALERVSRDRTTIVIAHRLSTIKKADHIIVLRAGQKVEEGTHETLLSNFDGLYSGLVRAQMIDEGTSSALDESIDPPAGNLRQSTGADFKTLEPISSVAQSDLAASDAEKAVPSGDYRRKGFWHIVVMIISEQRSKWHIFTLTGLGAMGAGAAYALQSFLFAHLVQAFQYTGHRLTSAANFWALMFFILALSVAVCYAALGWGSALSSAYVGQTLRKDYFRNMLKMPITYFDQDDNASGTVMSRLSSDPKQIQELMGLNSAFPLIGAFDIIGCIIVSFYFGWKLTLVGLFAAIPVIAAASFVRVRYEVQFEKMNSEVFSKSSQFATEAIGAFRTVSSLALEKNIIAKYKKLLDQQITATTRKATYSTLIFALTDSVELCSMALVFWYGGQLLGSREYSPIQFFVIYAATIQSAQMAGMNLSLSPNIAYATAAANRILELRHATTGSTEAGSQMRTAKEKLGAQVEFENVSFQYAGLTTPLFSKLNLSIQAGQFVAFVGPSGCGKTTTISLLERFYSPTSGRVTVDGQDISTVEIMSYRQELSLVAQEPRLFSGTVRQNLAMGINEDLMNEDDMIQACKDAEIHDFIASLPDGYETELGQHTQTALSGGQKQRLCLARALLRKPKLLLLDEATSSLDSQSEKLVQGAIERLAGQRSMTVIAVAHRLATIQKADVIFVFGERDVNSQRGSKIVESGSHNELLAKRGAYWSMCQAQALDK